MIILGTNSIKDTGYDVANSLRFNSGSSDRLERSKGATETSLRIGTFSFWVKRVALGTDSPIYSNEVADGNNRGYITITAGNALYIQDDNSGGAADTELLTTQVFRDTSAWSHFVIAFDTTQGTAANRCKVYHNGTQITLFSTETYATLNEDLKIFEGGQTNKELVGQIYGAQYSSMYLSEFVYIDGQQLAPTDFGEFDEDSGIWKPIDVSGLTFGNNGFYLEFKGSGTSANSSGIGADTSGNDNHFTVVNLTAIDQSTDTCTNNFATLNPLENFYNQSTFSEGNLQVAVGSSQYSYNLSTIGVSSGKWYCEMKPTSAGATTDSYAVGITSTQPVSSSQVLGYHPNDVAYRGNGNKKINNSDTSYGNSYTTNDIIGIALNLDDNEVKFYKNGTVQNSGTAISITAPASTGLGNYFFGVSYINTSNTATFQANFGSPPFAISSGNTDGNGYGNMEYAVPSGYYVLNSKNLSEFG